MSASSILPRACAFAALLSLVLGAARPAGAVTDGEAKCINALNKNFQKVSSTQGKEINGCIKDFSRGSLLGGQTVTQCTAADRRGKVAKAQAKTESDFHRFCSGNIPPFGPNDDNVVNQTAKDRDLRLLEELFGASPDTAIFTLASDAENSACQQAVSKSVSKCQETKLKEFNKCKKAGLKAATVNSAATLTSICLQALVDDPKGKIAKACDDPSQPDKMRKSIAAKCTDEGVTGGDLAASFPGCATTDPDALHACLEQSVECQVCKALAEADGLDSSACDTFDDGVANGSCGCGDGVVDASFGEQCDDGNQSSDDGCNAQCQTEFCGDSIIQPGIGEDCESDDDCGGDEDCNASCVCQCDVGLTECSELCVDTSSDEQNCGDCGITCDFDEICSAGSCVCPPGQTLCGGACVDTNTDESNCGTCGTTCDFDEICSSGSCVCPPGQTLCGGACVDTNSDEGNCGTCGTTCDFDEICSSGSCVCPPGQTLCSGACTNTATDLNNCGVCGTMCTNAHGTTQCTSSACNPSCASLFGSCDGNLNNGCETSLSTLTNCGSCGSACSLANAGESCTTGSCLITSCNTGFCNEDGSHSTGCERDLDTGPACPGTAVFIGSVSGDTGSGSVSNVDEGEKWLRVSISENDSGVFSCNDLSATITLTPPSGTDYDLRVFCDNCTTVAGSSLLGGSAVDTVQVRWDEDCFLGIPTGSESGRDIYILVEHFSANICNDWNLTVQGNTSGGSNTCSTK